MSDPDAFVAAAALLGRPVRHRGVDLGVAVDVFFDPDLERALGFEVETVGGDRLFLPWSAWEESGGAIEVPIPLSLLSDRELAYYDESGCRLSDLAGATNGKLQLDRKGRLLGRPARVATGS